MQEMLYTTQLIRGGEARWDRLIPGSLPCLGASDSPQDYRANQWYRHPACPHVTGKTSDVHDFP